MASSRLDRLILLLDQGSTPSVRLTAARQLGAIAAVRVSHPSSHSLVKVEDGPGESSTWRGVEGEWNEVLGLVARVSPHLYSRSMDTRHAAAAALSHISRAVGVWDPSSTSPSSSSSDNPLDALAYTPNSSTPVPDLQSLDVQRLLAEGTLLLASSGNEYAKLAASLTAEELANAQKDALTNLGLGSGAGADDLGVDFGAELAAGAGGAPAPAVAATPVALPPPRFAPSAAGSLPPPKFKAESSDTASAPTLSTSDAPPPPVASTSTLPRPPPPPLPAPSAEPEDPYAGLSAREKNKLKRKRKSEAKGGVVAAAAPPAKVRVFETPPVPATSSPTTSASVMPGTQAVAVKAEEGEGIKPDLPLATTTGGGEVVVIDPGAKAREREAQLAAQQGGEVQVADAAARERESMEVKVGEWPWRTTVDRLSEGLLALNWETRHGAALGLKEVLRLQGGGGGQLAGLLLSTNGERHRLWAEELAAKLFYVFALDRFGDYISDQVVAPVRETAAQALATLLPFMPSSSVIRVQRVLIDMIEQDGAPPSRGLTDKLVETAPPAIDTDAPNRKGKYVWQVRHSGLLGLKYLVAVKGDMLRERNDGDVKPVKDELGDVNMELASDAEATALLKVVVDAALLGLRDRDDDVRSAAASTLAPIVDALVHQLPTELAEIVGVLWDCLSDLKDDLSSSIGGVMDLLAKLLAFPAVLDLMQSSTMEQPLSELVPRLFPFFRHTITSVRLAVLHTTAMFLSLPSIDHSWADSRLLRLLFQNLIVEDRLEIRRATVTAWETVLALSSREDSSRLQKTAGEYIESWFAILSTPVGQAINVGLFWSAKVSLSGQGGYVYNVDKAILAQDLSLVSVEQVMRGRVAAATALGALLASWPIGTHDSTFGALLQDGLDSTSAFRRFLSATIVEEWATAVYSSPTPPDRPLVESSTLASRLTRSLQALLASDSPPTYAELSLILTRLHTDCTALYTALAGPAKVPTDKVPALPSSASFAILHAHQVAASYDVLVPLMGKGVKSTTKSNIEERQRKIVSAIGYYEMTKEKHDRQVYAALGGAVVALRAIPAKLTPVIRSITNSIKAEADPDLQARSASAIAAFIDICSSPSSTIRTNPSDKLVKNLCTFLCQDTSKTPIFSSAKGADKGILTLEFKPARGLAGKDPKGPVVDSDEVVTARLVHRGAQLALAQLASRFGDSLLDRVPKLWSCMSDALLFVFASGDVSQADALLASDDKHGQDLLDCLTVLPAGAQKLGVNLHRRLYALLPSLALATQSRFAVVRYAVAKCFAALCDIVPTEGLRHVVESVVPVLGDPLNVSNRRGAIELISHIVELLDVKILPYVIFLVVPVLGRMSDPDDDVRLVATNTFATLIKLVPLEAGLPDPPGFSADLLAKRQHEREFLTQLLDGNKVAEYKIPIDIDIELRKYQRDGVSWLAFLAKYQLHGLLCDDMGLGKTLQSICILASMHHERAERHRATNSLDTVHLPSLIICPPTLTGHWQQEIKTYAKNLRPLVFTGAKADRERMFGSVNKYDAVITSYEIARNDIDLLSTVDWHYCILDEGHIIKNGKTKLTKAVKSLRAIHRLILSGTPIQNNVLELWSLFDFLMPGFLGSEKAFNDRFGKPIAASRDAKSSSKEQEAGALALEALHKQVLPFLLRRLKEDVLDDLPPKIIQDYYCELSPLQKQLYDDFSSSQAKQLVDGEIKSGDGANKPQHVFQALQYLRKLVNHPALVIKPEVPAHQAIVAKLAAGGGTLRDPSHAPKLQALKQILLDCGIGTPTTTDKDASDADEAVSQHRVLIFCQLKQMLDIVEHDLLRTLMPSVTYMRMDGSTDVSKRHAVVQTFNADPSIDVLLLTTHVGGLGLNLTGADTVIFVEHDWNPMKDLQAMDRAHRLGQKKVVNVYRLIMRGTLEEKIMGLQRFKLNIASSVVTQQNSDLSSLGTESILDLFNVSAEDASPVVSKEGPVGQKALLEGLEDLPPEDEYQDLDFASFTASR